MQKQTLNTVFVTELGITLKDLISLKEGRNKIKGKNNDITIIEVKNGEIFSFSILEKKFKMKKEVIDITSEDEFDSSIEVSLGNISGISDIQDIPSDVDNSVIYKRTEEGFSDDDVNDIKVPCIEKNEKNENIKKIFETNTEDFSDEEEEKSKEKDLMKKNSYLDYIYTINEEQFSDDENMEQMEQIFEKNKETFSDDENEKKEEKKQIFSKNVDTFSDDENDYVVQTLNAIDDVNNDPKIGYIYVKVDREKVVKELSPINVQKNETFIDDPEVICDKTSLGPQTLINLKKDSLIWFPGTIISKKEDVQNISISKNYSLYVHDLSNHFLKIRKSCRPNCELVFRIHQRRLYICLKTVFDINARSIFTIRHGEPVGKKIQLCELNHNDCHVVTNENKKNVVDTFIKNAYYISKIGLTNKELKILNLSVDFGKLEIENILSKGKDLKNYSNLIFSVCVFRSLGAYHKGFHRTPNNAKLEHSNRRSNIKMIECFICISKLNELYGTSKPMGFTFEEYEDYCESQLKETEEKKKTKRKKGVKRKKSMVKKQYKNKLSVYKNTITFYKNLYFQGEMFNLLNSTIISKSLKSNNFIWSKCTLKDQKKFCLILKEINEAGNASHYEFVLARKIMSSFSLKESELNLENENEEENEKENENEEETQPSNEDSQNNSNQEEEDLNDSKDGTYVPDESKENEDEQIYIEE